MKQLDERLALQRTAHHAQDIRGGGVGLENLLAGLIDDQNGFRHELEKNAIARFRLAQPDIVAFHGLLGVQQPLLHRRHAAQVAAERDDAAVIAGIERQIAERDGTARRLLIDLAPARVALAERIAQEFFHLGAALGGDGIDPAAFDDVPQPVDRHVGTGNRNVADDAFAVDHHGDVARRGHHPRRSHRIETADRVVRRLEVRNILTRLHFLPNHSRGAPNRPHDTSDSAS